MNIENTSNLVSSLTAVGLRPVPVPKDRKFGCTRLCAVEYAGADPTGKTESTAAIQKAIDSLPALGGVVHIPNGKYLVDPVIGIKLRSNMWLSMDSNAILVAKTNDKPRYGILKIIGVNDVLVTGGGLKGDRYTHIFAPQTTTSLDTHEWGHAIDLFGSSRVTIRGVTLRDCCGDGISASAITLNGVTHLCDDIFIKDCLSTNNRRQGYSIGKCSNVVIQGGTISHINGTMPQDGIDIEPESGGAARNIFIDGVTIELNAKNGIEGNHRSNVDSPVEGVQITNCIIRNNGGAGTYMAGVNGLEISGNTITGSAISGTYLASNCLNANISGNSYAQNYDHGDLSTRPLRLKPFDQIGVSKSVESDILIKSLDPSVVVGLNHFG